MKINNLLQFEDLKDKLDRFWELSGNKIIKIKDEYDVRQGSPVFTVRGKYTARGWTEWTQGFQFGSAILQFDATSEYRFLEYAKKHTIDHMATHVSHIGVHDHGFNNISTYGNLLRLMMEGKIPTNEWERHFYELALKVSGAVQASRWTTIPEGGFIYSFNGPHSLFVDTMRSIRSLMVAHLLGHSLQSDHDEKINLFVRAFHHMAATAKYSVFYGEGRDQFDVWGRTAHESIFNVNDGHYRCPNAQQGFSGFTTWTRGLSWAMAGFAEELELIDKMDKAFLNDVDPENATRAMILKAAKATCDFYISNSASDGIPYWDTGAPQLYKLGDDYLEKPADPFNDFEPVDSTAAAIGAQGLLRLGNYLKDKEPGSAEKYTRAGLTIANRLFGTPYLSTDPDHQGLLLHSIYHQPNGWDHIPGGSKIAYGESSMWGDYHARELALYIHKIINSEKYYCFFNCIEDIS